MKGNLEQEKTERTEMGSRERPILFSGAMVRAILSGGKTQTRRVVKPQPIRGSALKVMIECPAQGGSAVVFKGPGGMDARPLEAQKPGTFVCPYGQPGDRLWVREEHFMHGRWEQVPDVLTKGGKQKWCFVADSDEVIFDAAELNGHFRSGVIKTKGTVSTAGWHKRLARFMPRKASRITLEIVSVRVERLQDICEADALAEGILKSKQWPALCEGHCGGSFQEMPFFSYNMPQDGNWYPKSEPTAVGAYRRLWELINDPGSWALNPWVWVVEFKRV